MTLIEQCREAADRLGMGTTYDAIIAAIRGYQGPDQIGFALGLTSYLNDRKVNLPFVDTRKYNLLNQKVVKLWKARR